MGQTQAVCAPGGLVRATVSGPRDPPGHRLTVLHSLFRDLSPNPRITHCGFSLEALGLCCRFLCLNGPAVTDSLRPVGAGGSSLKSWRVGVEKAQVPEWSGAGVEVGSRDRPYQVGPAAPSGPTQTSMEANPGKTQAPPTLAALFPTRSVPGRDWVDSRTVYVGHGRPRRARGLHPPENTQTTGSSLLQGECPPGLPAAPRALRAP